MNSVPSRYDKSQRKLVSPSKKFTSDLNKLIFLFLELLKAFWGWGWGYINTLLCISSTAYNLCSFSPW